MVSPIGLLLFPMLFQRCLSSSSSYRPNDEYNYENRYQHRSYKAYNPSYNRYDDEQDSDDPQQHQKAF